MSAARAAAAVVGGCVGYGFVFAAGYGSGAIPDAAAAHNKFLQLSLSFM